jgi:putative ABC transport system permease protein
MLKNYFRIAWRNLIRNKTYSLLILCGLATGMTCAAVLWLYVYDELSFDRYHRRADRIYRLNLQIKWSGNEYKLGIASAPFGPALQDEYPGIEQTLRVKKGAQLFRVGQNSLNVKELICADSTLFNFFDYQFLEGNPAHALKNQNDLVLTEKLAKTLFGRSTGVIGRIVAVKDNIPFVVSGVIKEAPTNHHLKFDAVLPYYHEAVSRVKLDKWDGFNSLTYLLLSKDQSAQQLEKKFPAFYKKYIAEHIGDTGEGKVRFEIGLQALTDIHLHSSHLMGEENGSTMSYVLTFSIIGLFILLIAIVNYVNLATARAAVRAKEIGIRKAVGSKWAQLVGQFLTESVMMAFLALSASILLLTMLLPFFNEIADKSLAIDFSDIKTIACFAVFAILTGLVSGLYPAFILSRANPVQVLKGVTAANASGAVFRKGLVVFQFFISMVMIAGTITVYRQLNFMRNTELGFNQQHIVKMQLRSPMLQQNAVAMKERLLKSSLIDQVTLTNGSIGEELNNKTSFSFYKNGTEATVSAENFGVDTDFTNALQIRIKQGRGFSAALDHDSSNAVLINEAMLKRLGWKSYREGLIEVDTRKIPVTGVISDFHLRSLHHQIEPLVLILKQARPEYLLVRVSGKNLSSALDYIKATFQQLNPHQPFEFDFLDQAFARQYRADEQKSRLFLAFSAVAIIIACLGLFGLATFTTEQRRKEIGVRKVLGASAASIVTLLSGDFLKLVAIAILIAIPVGLYLIEGWLQNFPYKVPLDWSVFVLAGSISLGISLITISFQSIRAAIANPVKSLHAH